jgi:acyl-CoA thioester hydrolase
MILYKGISHPSLCDVMGHMTTRHYVAMFDDASYHLLYTIFGWSGEQAKTEGTGWADVRHVIEYLDEVAEGDLLEITGTLVKIGTKSITALYTMHNLGKATRAATLESTSVFFDLSARLAIPITDEMRVAAISYLDAEAN